MLSDLLRDKLFGIGIYPIHQSPKDSNILDRNKVASSSAYLPDVKKPRILLGLHQGKKHWED